MKNKKKAKKTKILMYMDLKSQRLVPYV